VVAAQDDGAFRGERRHHVDHRIRLGAIADMISEQREARGARGAGVRKARLQRQQVRVHVGQQGQLHRAAFQ